MEDSIHEKHLNNPINNQEENLPDEVISTNEKEAINQHQETENMEVHYHSHSSHGKKNWKSYFWEFFMHFLAVSYAFLAELQLEYYFEHKREKKYAALLYRDLQSDTTVYGLLNKKMQNKITHHKNEQKNLLNSNMLADSSFARIVLGLRGAFEIDFTSTSFNKMKTPGSLRYFHNDTLIAKLSTYYDRIIPDISRKFKYINEKLHT